MKIDNFGEDFIIKWEKMVLTAYKCDAGVWTIGVGMTRYPDGSPVKPTDAISQEQAFSMFREMLTRYENLVNSAIKVDLSQNQFNALVSLCWNVELPFTSQSGLVKQINSHNFSYVPQEMAKWNKYFKDGHWMASEGLSARRFEEASIFMGWRRMTAI